MNILIIEDEPRAANQLQSLLKASNFDYQLLDVLDSVEESVKWLSVNDDPELIFMDIQLADGLSFEIFQKVKVEAPIIFTTAFDQYAIQAFKVNSVDYLLKPIQKNDLELAINKYKKSNQPNPLDPTLLNQLLKSMQTPSYRQGVLVKEGSGFVQIKTSDLLYIYSDEGITFGITLKKRFIIDETLDQFFNALDPDRFFRINRGQVVSKNAVQKIESYFNHRVKLTVQNPRDQEFIVSRQKTTDFKRWMNF